ncbi:nucleoporin 155 [Naegleria gruberi]|uniref:Nucleoporin 155 n=1 Tax=Naegleria gruberi TaxID=5762 RepID=D2UXP7_NAEGR|nr:nucleoporin 155 [Naegleria gruberi]EFC50324.1 nucleoporin 155 [Naegleria gruberi]|eukprot:XP_002683068.1 nucleoporin 155 [Naegleria gruberi strain NEG-M]
MKVNSYAPSTAFNFNAPVVGGISTTTGNSANNVSGGNLFNGSILPSSTKEQLMESKKLVNQNLEKDSKFVDIYELSQNQNDSYDELFVKKQFVALPDPIFEEYRRLEYKCFMGIFPEIHRAWITIDNKFFIWSYLDGSDFNEYDELDQIIISAGIVKPKPNIFKDYVKYLLVLATPIEIVLVALAFNNNDVSSPINGTETEKQQHPSFDSQTGSIYSEMELFPTNYIIPSDNVNMLKIVGTKNGRIFMCGKDGCLYELTYEPEEGWFKSKCRKLNHSQSFVGLLVPSFLKFTHDDPIIDIVVDDTRNILYTLSDNMTIEVYDLGENGDSMRKVVSYSNLLQDMMRKFPNYNCNLNSLKIISIAPISENESKAVHLVAITSKGDRIFFTTGYSQDGLSNSDRPIGISLLHIKSVSFTSNTMSNNKFIPGGLHKIHECFYKDGVCILADELSNQVDSLVCLSMERKYGEYGFGLNENVTTKHLDNGMTHSIAEIPLYLDPVLVSSQNSLNELSFQHIKPPREFVCLSNNGMHLLVKLRPVDFLQQILQQSQSDSLLNNFFTKYSDDEACAMCVMLACAPPAYNNITDHDQQPTLHDEMLIKRAEQAFFKYGGLPRLESQERNITNNTMGGPVSAIDIKYSAQHNGLYLYFTRLMRPLWISPVFNSRVRDNETLITSLRYSPKQLKYVQQCLFGIYNFLKRNPQLHEIQSNVKKSIQEKVVDLYNTKKDEEAKRLEQRSIHNLYVLLKRCYQGLIFLYFMDKCKLATLFSSYSHTRISQIARMPFCDLFLTSEGEKMMKEMVRMVVMRSKEVDAKQKICEELKSCDEFFDPKDLEEYKALDALEKAKIKHDQDSMFESLEMFKKIAGHINILVVCKEFQKLGYYTGAVELALTSAEQRDPSNLALEWIKAGKPALDMAGQQAFAARNECYTCALSSLDLADNEESPIIGNQIDKETKFSDILEKMSKSKDSLFHDTLYQWLIEHNLSEKLLSLNTPFIENFLIKQNKHYEELSSYYFNNRRYDKAAKVLLKLAETKSDDVNLDGRIQHLTHAINYAKAAQTQDDLLNSLQDKLDVALIQRRVLKQIQEINHDSSDIIADLESSLFDINTLYNKYAEPFDLLESRLCILHCAKYKNHELIQDLWNELIDISIKENNLESKIISLGKELTGIYFPLEFICGQLEKRTLDSNFEAGWVVKLMRDKVGVKYTNLYNAYHNLYILLSPTKSKVGKDVSMFYNQGRFENLPDTKEMVLRILENIAKILGDWLGEINTPYDLQYVQTFSLGDIKKDVNEYISALNSFSKSSKTDEIKKNLKNIVNSI